VTVKELTLGHVAYKSLEMVLVPRKSSLAPTVDQKPIAGLLTSSLFEGVDAELNLAQNKINLFEQTICGGGQIYWGGEYTVVPLASDVTGLLIFPFEVDGQTIQASFNTRTSNSKINSEVTQKYFGFDAKSPGVESDTLANGNVTRNYRAMALTAKGLQIRNAKITILTSNGWCVPSRDVRHITGIGCEAQLSTTPLTIGTDLLKKLRVYIASKEKHIYFTRADSVAQASEPEPAAPAQ
jgi:hypothetical protein